MALGKRLEEVARPEAKERQREGGKTAGKGRPNKGCGKKPQPNDTKTRAKVGASVGMSGRTYEKRPARNERGV